ncbi:hypothetical protein BDP55DRAFT_72099 [Colletotrichum godetiae]|uniref:Uncharacterized protein n=1 Tax=Colletotrichum godetiae TaxID=1209918 RepID=A0AAJ0EXQ8_9PEZI|nr:uncharacterized protein BDP55DRAFT_72099 [Colletotrichum godetiae]KAK1687911.1 hypothetical protein BDP55DRAFT_72099 [Colletotrichum godetiae]
MPGKAWSKEEERVYWRFVIPQSAKRVDGGPAVPWDQLAVYMQKRMGANAKREYTHLSLLEHYFQNFDKERFSPHAAPYVREAKRIMASIMKSQSQSDASVPSQDAQLQDSFNKHTGETTDEDNGTILSNETNDGDADYIDDGDEDAEGEDDHVDPDDEVLTFIRDMARESQRNQTAARSVKRAAGQSSTLPAPVADMSSHGNYVPGLAPQHTISQERSTLPPRPPRAVTRVHDYHAFPYESPRPAQHGREPPQKRARLANPFETNGYYDQGLRTQAYYGQQSSRQAFYNQGPRMQSQYGQDSGSHGYYDQNSGNQAHYNQTRGDYGQITNPQGFEDDPDSVYFWDQSAKDRSYYERGHARQRQQYIDQCHGLSDDNQDCRGQSSSSHSHDQNRSVQGPFQNHEHRVYDQNEVTRGYYNQNRNIQSAGQNHENRGYDQSRNQHDLGNQGYHANAAYNTSQHLRAPSVGYSGQQPAMGSHQYHQDPQCQSPPQLQQSAMGYSEYPIGNRPSASARLDSQNAMARYSDRQVPMSPGRSSVPMSPNYDSSAQHSVAPSPGGIGHHSTIPDYIQRPSTASSGYQQPSRRPSVRQQASEDHHLQGAHNNNREEPKNEQFQHPSSTSGPLRQHPGEDHHRQEAYMDRREEPENEQIQRPPSSVLVRQEPIEYAHHQSGYMNQREQREGERFSGRYVSPYPPRQHPAEHNNGQGGVPKNRFVPEYEPEMFQAFEAESARRKE